MVCALDGQRPPSGFHHGPPLALYIASGPELQVFTPTSLHPPLSSPPLPAHSLAPTLLVSAIATDTPAPQIGTNPAPNTHTLTTLHLKLKTSTLIRAAQTLRDTAHELRLALALGDDIATASRRDAEAARLKVETEALRREVTREFGLLVSRAPVGAAAAGGAAVADGGAGD